MATFYFNGAVDNDWNTLGNWWLTLDLGTFTFSNPAPSLPGPSDTVEQWANINGNSGSEPTIAEFVNLNGYNIYSMALTVTGTFLGTGYVAPDVYITGNVDFNGSAMIGMITGNVILRGTTFTSTQPISGNLTTYDDVVVQETPVGGTCNFYDRTTCYPFFWGNPPAVAVTFWDDSKIVQVGLYQLFPAGTPITLKERARNRCGAYDPNDITFQNNTGINGSSILGVI
jgi:hypothetical protein